MAANEEDLLFHDMNEAELRQWVESNPGSVDCMDMLGVTPLLAAVCHFKGVPLIQWLVNEKGADVNATNEKRVTSLHITQPLDVFNALLTCGADPSLLDSHGFNQLMMRALDGRFEKVKRLLQDPRM